MLTHAVKGNTTICGVRRSYADSWIHVEHLNEWFRVDCPPCRAELDKLATVTHMAETEKRQ